MDDLISRKAAIDAVGNVDCSDGVGISAIACEVVEDIQRAIKDLPSAPPDMSEYSDKLWKAAYERGKAEALDEIIHCKDCKHWSRESICDGFCSEDCMRHDEDFYCGYAERRTDEGD